MDGARPLADLPVSRASLLASAAPGTAAARALSDLTDSAIAAQAEALTHGPGVSFALFALGGYGARRLLPGSDIDLLVVSRASRSELDPLIRGILYPLWDAGLTVGHQVRTPREQLTAATADLRNATGFLAARLLAGDPALAAATVTSVSKRISRKARSIRAGILARERTGSPYLLEPDLKDGAGGQRDIDELVWHAAILAGRPVDTTEALVEAGLMSSEEFDALLDAQDAITAARWGLHIADPRAGNLLTLDLADAGGCDPARTQSALVLVHNTLLDVRERLAHNTRAGAGAGARVAPWASPSLTLESLRALAGSGEAGLEEAERAAYAGRADRVLPGFSRLMTLRRPALSHRYTVGAHSLRAVQAAGRLMASPGFARVDAGLRDATLVAALAHDVGKRLETPGHPARGAGDARVAAFALGLPPADADAAATLVAEHLLLSGMALTADLSDEDAILRASARLGDSRLVAPLYTLTEADMEATGPDVWNAWTAALVGDLAGRFEQALSPEIDGAGIVTSAARTRAAALRQALSVGASRAVLDFLESAPLRYLARRTADEVLRDGRLVQSLAGPGSAGAFAFNIGNGPADGIWRVDIATRDQPGLFALLAGTIALAGLSALSAEAFTSSGGIAIDTFTVVSATLAPVGSETWNRLDRHLQGALVGHLDLETRLAERREHYRQPASGAFPPEITIDEPGTFTTRVRVLTPDRVGLLHDLARAFHEAGFDIARASVATISGMADDTFEVIGADGQPPEPENLEDTLRPLLKAAVLP